MPSATRSDAVGQAAGPPGDGEPDADVEALCWPDAELADGVLVTVAAALDEAEEAVWLPDELQPAARKPMLARSMAAGSRTAAAAGFVIRGVLSRAAARRAW
ncbi:MAG TPA: hypothetical protein VMK13_11755 [Streptosporangiaceae bacterium]|nr:hypothetical protein [Streptosporangiaceae bacterium]